MPQTAAAWTNHDFYLTEGSTNKFSALLHECDSGGGGVKTKEIAVPAKEPPAANARRASEAATQTRNCFYVLISSPFAFSHNSTWRSEYIFELTPKVQPDPESGWVPLS